MNDIRRTILWVIFGFSMVLLWDQWQVFNGKQATFFPSAGKPPVGPALACLIHTACTCALDEPRARSRVRTLSQ